MVLLSKEIDKYISEKYEGRVISEYIIYVMCGETITSAYIELGDENKIKKINELLND
jgi:hypothetical protein